AAGRGPHGWRRTWRESGGGPGGRRQALGTRQQALVFVVVLFEVGGGGAVAEDGGADADEVGAALDADFEVSGHTHREDVEGVAADAAGADVVEDFAA